MISSPASPASGENDDIDLSRLALLWPANHHHNNNNSGGTCHEYWDTSAFSHWVQYQESMQQRGLTYESFFQLTASLTRVLKRVIAKKLESESSDAFIGSEKQGEEERERKEREEKDDCKRTSPVNNLRSLTIAVAIPEGPFLPLAISCVHALNQPFRVSSEGTQISCVLVPLDPTTEGVDRLQRMIVDSWPFLILTAHAQDYQRLEQILSQFVASATDKEKRQRNEENVPLLVNFLACVENASLFTGEEEKEKKGVLTRKAKKPIRTPSDFRSALLGRSETNGNGEESQTFPRISHIVYTSGTTGVPKGCVSSIQALDHYMQAKNKVHGIDTGSTILLASSLSFDPCLSDILATLSCGACLALVSRQALQSNLACLLNQLQITHVLCTPTLWGTMAIMNVKPSQNPYLKVVALGGEPIPPLLRRLWAREQTLDAKEGAKEGPRLMATYGCTEACVYQTAGEVFQNKENEPGQNVGHAFPGLGVRICREMTNEQESSTALSLQDVDQHLEYPDNVGEVILFGAQLDQSSGYWNQDTLSQAKFIDCHGQIHYRTGDRGFLSKENRNLHILGRIGSETGMVKINGIRVELGEIESSLVDDVASTDALVVDSMVVADQGAENKDSTAAVLKLVAYVVLGKRCQFEVLCGDQEIPKAGVVCSGSLLVLLRERCRRKSRITPNTIVLLPSLPLSPTGKRDRHGVPSVGNAVSLNSLQKNADSVVLLKEYGKSGAIVAEQIVDCLNLHHNQQNLLTTLATFEMLGGDSLAATRVVRGLYAHFHRVDNNRFLGGEYGVLDDDRFAVVHLLRAKSLGWYVDFLDERTKDMLEKCVKSNENTKSNESNEATGNNLNQTNNNSEEWKGEDESANFLSQTFLQAVIQDQSLVAKALLEVGADPNIGTADSNYRLGKTGSRLVRKVVFASTPLHHACLKGNPELVQALLDKHVKTKYPDASGNFPLHLAVSGGSHGTDNSILPTRDNERRWECVRLLLDEGNNPLTMKDGQRHTIVHSAARAGQDFVLSRILERWKLMVEHDDKLVDSLNWRDRWSRTAVHWAILNGHVTTLKLLLEHGCSANPSLPPRNKVTSAAVERPIDLAKRLYGSTEKGAEMTRLLQDFAS